MKKTKKTAICISVLCPLIVVAAAAISITRTNPDTPVQDTLLETGTFLYVSDGAAAPETTTLADVPSLFDPDDSYMKIWQSAVLDLDGDGEKETVLSVYGVSGDAGGYLILHRIGENTYAYQSGYRSFEDLKADGTFSYSDATGTAEAGVCAIAEFTETGYTVDKITYGSGAPGERGTFVVDHQPADEETFTLALGAQAEKADAVWEDLPEYD